MPKYLRSAEDRKNAILNDTPIRDFTLRAKNFMTFRIIEVSPFKIIPN